MNTESLWSRQEVCLTNATQMWLAVNHNTYRNVLHGQVSAAAVNQIYFFHEAMNSCENLKIHSFDTIWQLSLGMRTIASFQRYTGYLNFIHCPITHVLLLILVHVQPPTRLFF